MVRDLADNPKIEHFPRAVSASPVPQWDEAWARPFAWIEPTLIKARRHVYSTHYTRGMVSATFAPGGAGKTANSTSEAVAMATGQALLNVAPAGKLRVWQWSGEDPIEEAQRRLTATAIHYGIAPRQMTENLFIGSGRDASLVIAKSVHGEVEVNEEVVAGIIEFIKRERIDVVIIDPFVSSHAVPENDNGAIDRVAKTWARIAHETNAAVELVHHTRKPAPGVEISVEDGRGASALLYAARSARVVNPMSEAEADKAGVDREHRRSYFRVDNGKANLAPAAKSAWFRFVSVPLGNGDEESPEGDRIGVVTPWSWPDPFASLTVDDTLRVQRAIEAGEFRANVQAADWVGHEIGRVLSIDTASDKGKAKVKALIQGWTKAGLLETSTIRDAKGKDRPVVVVGKWVNAE